MNIKKFFGFTLNETLMAMAIVGVIAALTVPNIMMNYAKQTYVTALKKNVVELESALTLFQTENYKGNLYTSELATSPKNFMQKYLNLRKNCNIIAQPCFAESYGTVNAPNAKVAFTCDNGNTALLGGGAALCIKPALKEPKTPAIAYIDINGRDKPNIGGRDMFTFNINMDYTIDVIEPNINENLEIGRASCRERV